MKPSPPHWRGDFSQARRTFAALFGGHPRLFRAPGRVNIIGEHTDYNDGFVMPAAIDLYTWVAAAPRRDRRLRLWSEAFFDFVEIDIEDLDRVPAPHWSNYVRGVAAMLERSGKRLVGADLAIFATLPLGAGLSSSASLEVAVGLALLGISDLSVDRHELVRLCQRAEHEFTGTLCGIMDQFVTCFAEPGRPLALDCRSLDYEAVSLGDEVCLVVCNTMVKHELASGEYNQRRAQCDEAVRRLREVLPGIRALRDVSVADVERWRDRLPPTVYRRARHVVRENERVQSALAALRDGDAVALGRLMDDSHTSLRDDFEVSCRELDVMVEAARSFTGVLGARMTGGGFGGCTVNLVEAPVVGAFVEHMRRGYSTATGREAAVFVSRPAGAAEEIPWPG